MIGILDVKMGNLRSVHNAVSIRGFDVLILHDSSRFGEISHLVIPGVGSYRSTMEEIRRRKLIGDIHDFAASGRPLLGLCLGMQLLSDYGVEGGRTPGLGLVPGHVERMQVRQGFSLPHVGWNTMNFKMKHPVFHGLKKGIDCYFVHSYHVICDDPANICATTDYDQDFVSIIGKKNVLGFQFHPEKSQANGLKMLENFCNWNGEC